MATMAQEKAVKPTKKTKAHQTQKIVPLSHPIKTELCHAKQNGYKIELSNEAIALLRLNELSKINNKYMINGLFCKCNDGNYAQFEDNISIDKISRVTVVEALSRVKDAWEENNIAKQLFAKLTSKCKINNHDYLRFKINDIALHK